MTAASGRPASKGVSMDEVTARYPMKLRPIVLPKVWGGRRLEAVFGRSLPGREPIGEAWVAWDGLKVTNGRHRGATLSDLTARTPKLVLESETEPTQAVPLRVTFV